MVRNFILLASFFLFFTSTISAQSYTWSTLGNGLSITRQGATMPDLYIANNGNVGIGVIGAPHKLTVKGTVKSCRMEVEIDSWCDDVFEENY